MTVKTITPEINVSTGRMAFALRLDGVHCGYAESYLDADTLAAEITAKREAAAAQTAAYIAPAKQPTPAKTCERCGAGDAARYPVTFVVDGGLGSEFEIATASFDLCNACKSSASDAEQNHNRAIRNLTAWLESGKPTVEAYLAPRPTPRKAKVKKSRCTCPMSDCGNIADANGMFYCKTGKEWTGYHNGLLIASGDFLPVEDALRNHRYALLTKGNASPADLDPEQAADVLAARGLEPTA